LLAIAVKLFTSNIKFLLWYETGHIHYNHNCNSNFNI
jgi:hypothetical protein